VLASGVEVWKPTPDELEAAKERKLPDLIQEQLEVLFCGINPGLYSAATGHHFARPGNRFWPTLHASGFTPRLLHPFEERELLKWGLGITNLASRTTAAADELEPQELVRGAAALVRKVEKYRPRILAMVGLTAYRTAFRAPKAGTGLQARRIGTTEIWLLPNPSGLNAHHQPADLARLFGELRSYVGVRS
jgi:TDG/mug DNA glycosylase family protein